MHDTTEAKAAFLWIFGPALVLTFIHLVHSGRAFRTRRVQFPWAFWLCAAGAAAETIWAGGRLAGILFLHEGPASFWERFAVPEPGEGDWRVWLGGLVFNGAIAGAVLASPLRHLRSGYRPVILEATLRATGAPEPPREVMEALAKGLLASGFTMVDPKPWGCDFSAVIHRSFPSVVKTPAMVFAAFDSRGMNPVLRITVDVMDLVVEDSWETPWAREIAGQIKTLLAGGSLAPWVRAVNERMAEKPVL